MIFLELMWVKKKIFPFMKGLMVIDSWEGH